jgi:hypothetical protein
MLTAARVSVKKKLSGSGVYEGAGTGQAIQPGIRLAGGVAAGG